MTDTKTPAPETHVPARYAEGGYVSRKDLPLVGEQASSYPAHELHAIGVDLSTREDITTFFSAPLTRAAE